ncbi:MAG: hypothetical protein ABL904_17145 [Hyphomicrobiaceae bacterium]
MQVKLTHGFTCIPHEAALHGVPYAAGDTVTGYPAEIALRNGWGMEEKAKAPALTTGHGNTITGDHTGNALSELASLDSDALPAEEAAPEQPPVTQPGDNDGPEFRARLIKGYRGPGVHGEPVALNRNTILTGAIARKLVAEGYAVELAVSSGAPETK